MNISINYNVTTPKVSVDNTGTNVSAVVSVTPKVFNVVVLTGDQVNRIQIFNTPGAATYNKPVGAKTIRVIMIGGGGGGACGGSSATFAAVATIGGGSGAGRTDFILPAVLVPSVVNLIVGAGGAGRAGQIGSGLTTQAGANGGASIFGNILIAKGGIAAVSVAAAQAGQGNNNGTPQASGVGGAGSASGAALIAPAAQLLLPAGGGGSGGITSGNVLTAPAPGAAVGSIDSTTNNLIAGLFQVLAGGLAGTIPGGSGGDGGTFDAANSIFGGAGGGGGGGNLSGPGGKGGNGGFPGGGGGGGGAVRDGFLSGAGGNGGNGIIIVITSC